METPVISKKQKVELIRSYKNIYPDWQPLRIKRTLRNKHNIRATLKFVRHHVKIFSKILGKRGRPEILLPGSNLYKIVKHELKKNDATPRKVSDLLKEKTGTHICERTIRDKMKKKSKIILMVM